MVSSLDNWDGSLSKSVKQTSVRITDSSAGTSDIARPGWLDGNWTNDASNSNPPLSRDGLMHRPPGSSTFSTVASQSGITTNARKTLAFMPLASSPLHSKTPVVLTVPNPVASKGRLPMNLDILDTISTYTADGEGEDEAELEDVVLDDMLATYSPTSRTDYEQNLSHSSALLHDSPLFTPPAEDDTRSVNQLVTPCPSPKQAQAKPSRIYHQPRPQRLIMSHIEVPPFKRPQSAYRPFLTSRSSIVSRRRVPSGPPPTLQEVLNASFQHNTVGTLPYESLAKKNRKLTKKKNEEDREKIVVAGPSVLYPTGLELAQVAGPTKKNLKRPLVDDNDDDDRGPPSKSKKRSRLIPESIVDLTITDNDELVEGSKVKPNPKPKNAISKKSPRKPKFIHAVYNSETDILTLCLEDIRPVPLEVLTLNTQYLRQSLGDNVITNKEVSPKANQVAKFNINPTRQNGSPSCFLSTTTNFASTQDTVEEISVGGVIWELSEKEIKKEVIEILSDSDANLKENVPSVSTSQVSPSKPNAGLTKQHQKKPRESHRSQQPKQRQQPKDDDDVNMSSSTFNASIGHPTKQRQQPKGDDDVNRSSSTFNTSIGHPIPSSLKIIQYPEKPRKSQHSEQQQPRKRKKVSGDGINGSSMTSNTPHKQIIAPSSLPRPSYSPQSSPPGQHLSDYPNGVIPSAKALGKRRAISPMDIPVITTPQRHLHLPVPSYFVASIHDLQMTSHRSLTSTPAHNPYIVQNSDFTAFFNYPGAISPAVQSSSSAQVNGTDSINPSSFSSSYHPLDTLDSLYDQSSSSQNQSGSHIGSDIDTSCHQLPPPVLHTPTHSHILLYNSQDQPGSRGESFFSSADSLYNDVRVPGDGHDHHQYDHEPQQQYDTAIDNRWSSSLVTSHSEDQYVYDTIDPTLLGGGSPSGEVALVEAGLDMVGVELELDKEIDDQVQQRDGSQLDSGLSKESSPSPSSSTDSSFSSSRSTQPKTKSSLQSVSPSNKHVPADNQEKKRILPPRKRTKRVMPDMISHDDIKFLESVTSRRRLPSSPTSSAPDADRSDSDSDSDSDSNSNSDSDSEAGSESDDNKPTIRKPTIRKPTIRKPTIRKPIPKPKTLISPKHPEPIEPKVTVPRGEQNQNWPLDDFDSYCHQCRRKTFYAKMTCSDCQKKFCVRCYAFRYPECEFDADDKQYSCPACEGYCNCTVCCRRRGEPYVGVRTCDRVPDSPQIRPQRLRNKDLARVKLGGKTNLPAPTTAIPTTAIPQGVTQAWGSLYSVTGEKIGACFFNPSAQKGNSVVFAPATAPIMTTITEVAQQVVAPAPMDQQPKPQVKMKKKRRVFVGMVQPCWGYTKPKIKLLKGEPYAKRSYDAMPRYYVGKKKYLFYPREEDSESSLSSMDEGGGTNEPVGIDIEGQAFLPDSLGDGDIARAILLGLNACGVAAIEAPTT